MIEVWKDIAGYDGLYQVSNFGNVRSFHKGEQRNLKVIFDGNYLAVGLHTNGKAITRRVHRLVAQSFIPNPDGKREVNHINGIKIDNRVENLEWCTRRENQHHATQTGLILCSESRPRAKLTNEQVAYIRQVYKPRDIKFGATALAKQFGVSNATISLVVRGVSYRVASGKIHNKACLPVEQREEIRKLYRQGGYTQRELADKFGVGQSAIHLIIHETNDVYERRQ